MLAIVMSLCILYDNDSTHYVFCTISSFPLCETILSLWAVFNEAHDLRSKLLAFTIAKYSLTGLRQTYPFIFRIVSL